MWEKAEKETLLKSQRAPGTKMELVCVLCRDKSISRDTRKKKKRKRGNMWNRVGAHGTRNDKKARKQVWMLVRVCCFCHLTFIPTF